MAKYAVLFTRQEPCNSAAVDCFLRITDAKPFLDQLKQATLFEETDANFYARLYHRLGDPWGLVPRVVPVTEVTTVTRKVMENPAHV